MNLKAEPFVASRSSFGQGYGRAALANARSPSNYENRAARDVVITDQNNAFGRLIISKLRRSQNFYEDLLLCRFSIALLLLQPFRERGSFLRLVVIVRGH